MENVFTVGQLVKFPHPTQAELEQRIASYTFAAQASVRSHLEAHWRQAPKFGIVVEVISTKSRKGFYEYTTYRVLIADEFRNEVRTYDSEQLVSLTDIWCSSAA